MCRGVDPLQKQTPADPVYFHLEFLVILKAGSLFQLSLSRGTQCPSSKPIQIWAHNLPGERREYSGYEILMAHYHDKGCNNLDRKLNKRHPPFYLQFQDCICNLFLQEKGTASKGTETQWEERIHNAQRDQRDQWNVLRHAHRVCVSSLCMYTFDKTKLLSWVRV